MQGSSRTPEVDRIERERRFHNEHRFGEDDARSGLDKWYAAVSACNRELDQIVLDRAREKHVLEYGCADGPLSLDLLNLPAVAREFHGIDISDAAIAKANQKAGEREIRNAHFWVMNAEQMTFRDESFDVIFGRGIIHHLDLEKSFSELFRVLKPGGVAVFAEPMGHNPLINAFRRATPGLRTPDEHPLKQQDFALARRYFPSVNWRFFGLFTLLGVPMQRSFFGNGFMKTMEAIDRGFLSLPFVGRNAWFVLLKLEKPNWPPAK